MKTAAGALKSQENAEDKTAFGLLGKELDSSAASLKDSTLKPPRTRKHTLFWECLALHPFDKANFLLHLG